MLIIYSEDMHEIFFYSTIEIVRKNYLGRVLVLIPYNKFKKLGKSFFDLNQIEVFIIDYSKHYDFLKRISLTNKYIGYVEILNVLFFKNYKRLFKRIEDIIDHESELSFLALELYPIASNRLVRKLLDSIYFKSKTLFLHNIYGYKNTLINFDKSTLRKKLLYWLVNVSYKDEVKWFNNILVPMDYLVPEAQREHRLDTYAFPLAIPSKVLLKKREYYLNFLNNEKLTFVVPGSVENFRRDYKKIIESFVGIDVAKYELVFLGKLIDNSLISKCFELGVNLRYYKDYLSSEDYENEFLKCNFAIYSPNLESGYGSRKISGTPSDAFRHGVPLINLSNEEFENQFDIRTQDLKTFVETLIVDEFSYKEKYGFPALNISINHDLNQYDDVIKRIIYQ